MGIPNALRRGNERARTPSIEGTGAARTVATARLAALKRLASMGEGRRGRERVSTARSGETHTLCISDRQGNVRLMSTETRLGNRQRARLTRQGQITVPKAIRDALGARPGDDIEFVPRGAELLVEVRPRRSLLEFAGIAADAAARVPDSADDLDALIEDGMAEAAVRRAASVGRGSRRSR